MTAYKPRKPLTTHTFNQVKSKNAPKIFMKPKPNIMCSLPNDLIMRIVREADGGKTAHKKNLDRVFTQYKEKCLAGQLQHYDGSRGDYTGVETPNKWVHQNNEFWLREFDKQYFQENPVVNPDDDGDDQLVYYNSNYKYVLVEHEYSIIGRFWWGDDSEEHWEENTMRFG